MKEVVDKQKTTKHLTSGNDFAFGDICSIMNEYWPEHKYTDKQCYDNIMAI